MKYRTLTLLILVTCLQSCVYSFVNSVRHSSNSKIRSIAVEAVYDTSSTPMSHANLWREIQRAIIKDGYLSLTNSNSADAILTLQLLSNRVANSGSPIELDSKTTLDDFIPSTATADQITNLNRAGRITQHEVLGFTVLAEAYELSTGKKIYSKSYSRSATLKSIRGNYLARENDFLIHEEALSNRTKEMSKSMGAQINSDLVAAIISGF
jgi:hypothetical protein